MLSVAMLSAIILNIVMFSGRFNDYVACSYA